LSFSSSRTASLQCCFRSFPARSMATSRAIGFTVNGGPEVLHEVSIPVPHAEKGQLLVRVRAVSANPVDTKVRKSPLAADFKGPRIVGWDAAGVVEKLGEGVHNFKEGDEVYFAGDRSKQGSYSEYVAIDHRLVGHKPTSLSFADAASLPLVSLTAWEALFEQLHLKPGEVNPLLVVNGAGGVGSLGIQIARNVLKIPRVIATASRSETIDFVKKLGATDVVNHREPLVPQVKGLGLTGVDVVLINHNTNNALFQDIASLVNPLGKIVSILPFTEHIDLGPLFSKRITLSFELMFTRSLFGVSPEKQAEILNAVAKLVDQKQIAAPTTQVLNLWKDIQHVHQILESGQAVGKIVLTL